MMVLASSLNETLRNPEHFLETAMKQGRTRSDTAETGSRAPKKLLRSPWR